MAKRVLIVDDSLLMRKMIADALTADGWTVAGEAASGQEAVAKYVELQPDVVTLDIVMPDTGGIYALQNILRFDPQAKIVVVSAPEPDEAHFRGHPQGGPGFPRQAVPARTTASGPGALRGRTRRGRLMSKGRDPGAPPKDRLAMPTLRF